MPERPRGYDKAVLLRARGADIPHPDSVDIGDEVDPDRISASGTVIYPGCRLYGAKTVISAGCVLGAEAPVTLEDCRLGPGVHLKGGYVAGSVFLEGASMGSGAHVREGTLLEEQANGAHTVGLKQTILFPFVTLGSLINFCDCLMAGGTSRKDHSEVGSSYIHFNYTPDGNKTTASLFGDVPRGVMLNQHPIFLGGQGGTVGPVRVGYGTLLAAGSVLREDVVADDTMVIVEPLPGIRRPVSPRRYKQLTRILERNIDYLANLVALHAWYTEVRAPFFAAQELGELVFDGAMDTLASATTERSRRLEAMVATIPPENGARSELRDRIGDVLEACRPRETTAPQGLLDELTAARTSGAGYLAAVQGLSPEGAGAGVTWLQGIVDDIRGGAASRVPSLSLFAH